LYRASALRVFGIILGGFNVGDLIEYYAFQAGMQVTFLKSNFLCQVLRSCQNTKKTTMATTGPEQAALYGLSTKESNGIPLRVQT
jgi:hypothetical protein